MKRVISILMIAVILVSCSSDEEIVPTEIPDFPPEATFLMDFSIKDANDGGRVLTKGNWGRSFVIVSVWSGLAALYTAVPVASFKEAFKHEPVFDASIRGWVWEYDFTALAVTYHARLESEITTAGVNWDMFVSQEGSFQNFNWYSGFSDISGLSGSWTLNGSPQNPQPALGIDWNRNVDGSTKDITYTNVVANDPNKGSAIFFEITNGNDYNRHYEIFQKVEDNTITMEWHKENKNGRIKDPLGYGDQNYHCWNENLDDVDC